MIRQKLQSGAFRKLAALVAAVSCYGFVVWMWPVFKMSAIDILSGMQKIAFVAAAFGVTAYNLRVRVVDLILKLNASPTATCNLAMIARSCGKKLTNLVLLFTCSAIAMGACGFVPLNANFSWLIAALSAALFGSSVVQFVYILFAFERLERFMLDDAEEQARERESNRLRKEP